MGSWNDGVSVYLHPKIDGFHSTCSQTIIEYDLWSEIAPHPQIATPKNQRQEGSALPRLPGASFFDPQVTLSTFGHSTLNISLNTGFSYGRPGWQTQNRSNTKKFWPLTKKKLQGQLKIFWIPGDIIPFSDRCGTILFGLLDHQELFSRHSSVHNEAILKETTMRFRLKLSRDIWICSTHLSNANPAFQPLPEPNTRG